MIVNIRKYSRVLYTAGAVLAVLLLVGTAIDLLMHWESFDRKATVLHILHLPVGALALLDCVSEYRKRTKKKTSL